MNPKKIISYLGFPHILFETRSKFNGKIKVVSVFGKNSISVENLTQTGPIVENLWSFALERTNNIASCLVLGVGGGSIIKVLRQKYPDSKITGVEIDKKMIDIGKKYFALEKYAAKIIIDDAFKFVVAKKDKYDLICIDLLVGRNAPLKLSSEVFFNNVKKILNNDSLVIINQLRLKGQQENKKLLKILNKVFKKVEIHKPLVNTLIFCS